MAHFDASDDMWPTSAFDEPTVVLDKSGMRIPAYALEGLAADQPVFERDDPETDKLLAQLVALRRSIKTRNDQLKKALADPAKKKKFAEIGIQQTMNVAKLQPKAVAGLGFSLNPLNWATSAYDAATDVLIGQPIGTQAASRNTAEHLQEMVQERVDTGQVTGERAAELLSLAKDNVASVSKPATVFVKTTAEEVGKNVKKAAGGLWTAVKVGVPVIIGLLLIDRFA